MERIDEMFLLNAVKDVECTAVSVRNAAVKLLRLTPDEAADALQSDVTAKIVETREGWLYITLPAMMPRRKEGNRARFLNTPIKDAILSYFHNRPLPHFTACVLVYEHIHDCHSRKCFVDHDNLELKHCQDVLENFFLENDSSALCSAFQCSHRGESDSTRIWILTTDQFLEWLRFYSKYWKITPKICK